MVEHEENNFINFLDVKVITNNGRIKFDIYKKPTNSGRYLNYMSNHSIQHKRSVIIGQLDRILFLSHPEFHKNNIVSMIDTLILNNYPLDIIFSTINNRIKKLSIRKDVHKNNFNNNNELNELNKKKYFTIPFINKNSDKFSNIASKNNFKISYKPINRFIKSGKDKLEKMDQCNVVYKICCLDCNASYVGQTKRKAKTRIKEHKSNIKRSNDALTILSQHQIDKNHKINWENIKILDIEPYFQKRMTSEMIHIKKINGMNKQSDTEKLPEIYFPLLNIPSLP
ncbi:hypothetical protein ALC60_00918 [Trachymyrmex zeteki]|uniref:Helix-turn-helix domain-containing protein n=1 Tax=Mycetomoellerius zeteki TaxID=64791 RepID=A0A151XI63_9HYME|nr:hypothetical protein ALC60_00918 [Trachymyrmex zeteki]